MTLNGNTPRILIMGEIADLPAYKHLMEQMDAVFIRGSGTGQVPIGYLPAREIGRSTLMQAIHDAMHRMAIEASEPEQPGYSPKAHRSTLPRPKTAPQQAAAPLLSALIQRTIKDQP